MEGGDPASSACGRGGARALLGALVRERGPQRGRGPHRLRRGERGRCHHQRAARSAVRQQPLPQPLPHRRPGIRASADRAGAGGRLRRCARAGSRYQRPRRGVAAAGDEAPAGGEAPRQPRHRHGRHRLGLAAGAGHRRALRHRLGDAQRRLHPPAAQPARSRQARAPGPRCARKGLRAHHPRHGQARRGRAQLFQRRGHHRPLRRGDRVRPERRRIAADLRPPRPQPGHHHGRAHGGRLRLPHRPPPPPRPRLHRRRPLGPRRRSLLRHHRRELGAGRHDQGEARGRRHRGRQRLPRPPTTLRLAPSSRLRRDPEHPRDQAPDRRSPRYRPDRRGRPQRQARDAAASARSSSWRRPSSSSGAAATRRYGCAARGRPSTSWWKPATCAGKRWKS